MVGNIAATIESRSNVDQLWVIVGRAHLPEMKHLLLQKSYQPLELPSPGLIYCPHFVDNKMDKRDFCA